MRRALTTPSGTARTVPLAGGAPDWRGASASSIVEAVRGDASSVMERATERAPLWGGIMISDAGFYGIDMSTSSEGRRKAEAALVHALDVNPDVSDPATNAAVRAYVDVLVGEGLLPDATVIAFKAAMSRAESLHRFESEVREQIRASLV